MDRVYLLYVGPRMRVSILLLKRLITTQLDPGGLWGFSVSTILQYWRGKGLKTNWWGGGVKKNEKFQFPLLLTITAFFRFGGGHRFVIFLGGSFFSSMVVLALGVLFLFVSGPHWFSAELLGLSRSFLVGRGYRYESW